MASMLTVGVGSVLAVVAVAIAIGAIALLWWGFMQMIPPPDEFDS